MNKKPTTRSPRQENLQTLVVLETSLHNQKKKNKKTLVLVDKMHHLKKVSVYTQFDLRELLKKTSVFEKT